MRNPTRRTRSRTARAVERVLTLRRPLLIAVDVDGTLAPIVDDPGRAVVPEAMQRVLRRLARVQGVRLALVTGRDRASLSSMVRVPGAFRAVEHGRRIIAPGERRRAPALSGPDAARLADFAAWAQREAVFRGARLEHKPASRAVHVRELHRRSPKRAARVLDSARKEARRLGLHTREGRAVVEAELESGNKGDALARIRRATKAKGVFYAGDDVTDYDAIRRAVDLGGVGVFVRSAERPRAPRGASLSVDGVDGMRDLLETLCEALASGA